MLLHYTVSEDDYLAFNIYHARHTPNYKRTIIGMCLLLPVLLAAATPLIFLVFPGTSPWLWTGVAIAVGGLWALAVPYRFEAMIRRHIKKITKGRNEFVGDFSLDLQEGVLVYAGNSEKNEIAYSRVIKIVQDEARVYLFLGPLSAVIVPAAAFADASQKQAFFGLLRAKCPTAEFALPAPV